MSPMLTLSRQKPTYLFALFLGLGTLLIFGSDQATATGVWSTNAPMPSARGALVAETIGDKIYVIGGAERYCCRPTVPVVEVYHPESDTWTEAQPPPDSDMWGPASAVVNGKIYVVGGWPLGARKTRVYDPLTDSWDYLSPSPKPYIFGHTAAVVNDEIYVIGGANGSHVTKYSPASDTWTTGLAPLPIRPRPLGVRDSRAIAGATIDGLIYVVGAADRLQIYNPETDSWSDGAPLQWETWRPSVQALSGQLYVFGGSSFWNNGGGDLADSWIYDPDRDTWNSISDMPTNRYWTAAALHKETVYVFGGWQLDNNFPLTVNESVSFNLPPDCSRAIPSHDSIWPPNGRMVAIEIVGITDPDGDDVTITVDSIMQDEPLNGKGDGNTSPDGFGVGSPTAKIRAERQARGNGRVYEIGFTAFDNRGGSCSGTVEVGVPHDRGKKTGSAINDGVTFDSTNGRN